MSRVRYVGADRSRDVAMPGGCVTLERMKWVDVVEVAVASGIPEHHAVIVARDLATAPDFEIEQPSKTTKTKPAGPDKEQDR